MEKQKQLESNLVKIKTLIKENLGFLKDLYPEDKSSPEYTKFKKAYLNYERLLGLAAQIKKIQ
jgi:hypothetical protein